MRLSPRKCGKKVQITSAKNNILFNYIRTGNYYLGYAVLSDFVGDCVIFYACIRTMQFPAMDNLKITRLHLMNIID